MKKFFTFILLLLTCTMLLFAARDSKERPSVNPKDGGFGISMASRDYQGDKGPMDISYDYRTEEVSGNKTRYNYSEVHMVATGGVWGMESYYDLGDGWVNDESYIKANVTIECPNGFYFQSASNPGARRPFKLLAVIKNGYSNEYSEEVHGAKETINKEVRLLSDGANSFPIEYTYTRPSGYRPLAGREYQFQFMWFDLVLCLPFDEIPGSESYVTSNGRMSADGRYYELAEADDYFALITIRVEWNGYSDEITIPLNGYYSRNENENVDKNTSLYIRPRASAANLDMRTMTGQYVDIADISFMSNLDSTYHMFLSASPDPYAPDPNGFRLIHSDVGYNEDPTIEEYLGFDLIMTTARKTTESGFETSGQVIFDGTDYAPSTSQLPDNKVKIESYPNNFTGGTETYAQYEGTVSILMDPLPGIMKEGTYREEVYVHILEGE